ncbi:4-demethylwyosine synthase TYW1 [Candidatus Pacearchaeota archaeon]|nr:4-demethylwyosine synthase TYW1 [Candidatus Pacearchaeota archaeon]
MIPPEIQDKLKKMRYGLVGNSSAVQVCRWTRNSLNGDRGCWKEKFYGISSSGCCQMAPCVLSCENQCLHCWRPIEMTLGSELSEVDDPIEILDGIVEERKKLMMGFGGNDKVDKGKFQESLEPSLFTMSLSGEPTIYPRLGEMFKEIRKRGAVSFLVTNGLNPEALMKLRSAGLPTQITISTNAPNEELFLKWHRSTKKEAWKKFNESLDVLSRLDGKVRRAIRMTLAKDGDGGLTNMSEENIPEYVELIKKANPDFVHVKGFMSVGYARDRMGYDKMPWFKEVKDYALKVLSGLGEYELAGEDERCCVVLLAKKGKKLKIDIT